MVLVFLSFFLLAQNFKHGRILEPLFFHSKFRKTSLHLGDGDCEWTDSEPFTSSNTDATPYGTLFASYPASGMRITWQQTEGITGIKVLDDFFQLSNPKVGLVKTQYPHYEGIWSYGQSMNQVVYVLRNPRWAMPSYLTLLSELDYAHTWQVAFDHFPEVLNQRAPMEDWIKWRDYRFEDELLLWGLHIDFYMENGAQYWMPYDFERNGQFPFSFLNETDTKPQDFHCQHDIDDCRPVAVVSYERLKDPILGPSELEKIANALRGKAEMTVLREDGIQCMWHDTWVHTPSSSSDNDDDGFPTAYYYNFTMEQLQSIEDKLVEYRDKYGTGSWADHPPAQDLVANFISYLDEIRSEIRYLQDHPAAAPTPVPNANYTTELEEWYNSKGKGNRYTKDKVQSMGIWAFVQHLYNG
mmetsp:Transcript_29339/g.44410  ORF Transcript_29339/g.44410 Transcript_29339/m.44410 type:complete len:412 (-) Transcript_29339:173-1408(-)